MLNFSFKKKSFPTHNISKEKSETRNKYPFKSKSAIGLDLVEMSQRQKKQ